MNKEFYDKYINISEDEMIKCMKIKMLKKL